MKKLLLIFFFNSLLLTNSASIFSQQDFSAEKKQILELQDKRTFGENGELINYLYSTDPEVREMALYALANIGDSSVIEKLNLLLAGPFDNYPKSKDMKAFAFLLGQIQSESSRELTEFMIKNQTGSDEEQIFILSEFVETIGKVGNEADVNNLNLLITVNAISDSLILRAASMSVARFALRKIKNNKSVDLLNYICNTSKDLIALRNAAYAYWRISDKKLLEINKAEIYNLSESEDAQTRMWAFNAMGKLQDKLMLTHTLEKLNTEPDWRVKVNMLNSLTNYKLDSIQDLTLQLLNVFAMEIGIDNEHVSLTTLNVLGKIFSDLKRSNNKVAKNQTEDLKRKFLYSLDSLYSLDNKNLSWRLKSELVNSMSLIFKDEIKNDLFRLYNKTNDYKFKSGIVKAFSNFDNGMIYKEVRDSISKDVQRYNLKNPNTSGDMIGSADLAELYRAFVEMLTELDDKVDSENQNIIRLIYSEFVSSKDPVIADLSLTGLKDSLYINYRDETNSVLVFDFNELEYPKDIDVMFIFIDAMSELKNDKAISLLEKNLNSENYDLANVSAIALEKITGKKYEFTAKPKTDFDWEYMQSLSQKRFITVQSNKGDIKIELLPEVAPFTVMNFLKLSENNFYDNTVFHRVVSNFVIQGGDPTGTGFGGQGYSIRSEFSPLSYETGMVGMASSGKDTEGSQFFITHSATPHLDGRYTIFGKVTDGMDVADEIMIGDFIIDVIIN